MVNTLFFSFQISAELGIYLLLLVQTYYYFMKF